ncbi:nucleoid-associated protein [Flagellimonas sp. HMM57]|uniref:nucleoid-associated protein n=1 Tax=unclassified Flagellimonas TaxID=2644544 RepID=UPI0013D25477|nr:MULTISPECIES: nucleoid-associated protein [unclassified Flagellimonas]UII75192.1 nucleoid-associated protein [Flagellimonas sp. HMM57]
MLNLYPAQIESVSLHSVGNKNKSEPIFLSAEPFLLNDEMSGLLKEYFFKPFREKEENYFRFSNEVDLEFNEVFKSVAELFENPSKAHSISKKITTHLYEQSNHPHIKSGEVYIVHFSDMVIDNEKTEAVGIFKSELKHDFLQFKENEQNLEILIRQGININKLDKGCIVFNLNKEDGYKVLSVDSNRYDAKYWLENFLGLIPLTDENFYTKNYLKFCQNFAKDVVLPAEDKQQEVMFMNRAVNHFAKNDEFEESSFLNEVLENPELIPEFKHYKVEKGPKYSIEDVSNFDIANKAVSDARKKIKNVINLDTNIQIKMDFINPESAEKFVEKGWDEEKQMYYYLVYFNKEQKS